MFAVRTQDESGNLLGMLRYRLAAMILLGLAAGAVGDAVKINRASPSVEHRKFDRNNPPSDMPQLEPQEALNRLRFQIEQASAAGLVSLEEGISEQVVEKLRDMGHPIKGVITGYNRATFGRGQIIRRDPQTGVLWAGSDPRSDGCAMGF